MIQRYGTALAVVAMAAATSAAGQQMITNPDWLKKPSADQLMAVWPHDMLQQGKGGKASISCQVNRQGALVDCHVVEESPPGSGFGAAAIALTPQFLMKPKMVDGHPVDGGTVRIPLEFKGSGQPLGPDGEFFSQSVATFRQWTKAPTYAEVVAAYPAKARAQHVGGRVTLGCLIKADRHLQSCEALAEEPKKLGLAEAARSLSRLFVAPDTIQGKETKGMLTQVPFTFAAEMLDPTPPLIGKATWTAAPNSEQLLAAWPKTEAKAGPVTVRVQLECTVIEGGKVDSCVLVSESPAGAGYGPATLSLAPYFGLSNWTLEGLPTVGGKVRIPIRYELGGTPPPPTKP